MKNKYQIVIVATIKWTPSLLACRGLIWSIENPPYLPGPVRKPGQSHSLFGYEFSKGLWPMLTNVL